eukprot:11206017-Lingulodinium_polyedra.AAC.1
MLSRTDSSCAASAMDAPHQNTSSAQSTARSSSSSPASRRKRALSGHRATGTPDRWPRPSGR